VTATEKFLVFVTMVAIHHAQLLLQCNVVVTLVAKQLTSKPHLAAAAILVVVAK
jgi:hypothetical protein